MRIGFFQEDIAYPRIYRMYKYLIFIDYFMLMRMSVFIHLIRLNAYL